jgi:hypothetical protein
MCVLANLTLAPALAADQWTPFRNAQFVKNLLGEKARLVQQAGYGHTSCKTFTPRTNYGSY